jgi:hypothetical protein
MTGKPIDWDVIEREFRAGQLSVREIARQYAKSHGRSISHTAIQKHAEKYGWTQNLAPQVRQQAEAALVADAVVSEVANKVAKANARETVNAAAERVVELVRQHRRDLAADNARVARLAGKLEELIDGVATLKDLETAQSITESIARTRSKLIPLERQAFSIGNGASAEDDDRTIKIEFVSAPGANDPNS